MRRTNRIEPLNINPNHLKCAFMITTTQLEIVRRVEITPIVESETDRVQTLIERPRTATPVRPSRKILWCIACLFCAAGILALLIMVTGLAIIFRRVNTMRKSNIERYDLGDLHYGISNVNSSSKTYLSKTDKTALEKYLSDQLRNEPGFRGVTIEDIIIQSNTAPNQRKPRDVSCSISFIIQNTQVYFDHCSNCINNRNIILRRLFFNRTAFREPYHLSLTNQYLLTHICSTPNKSQLIIPRQLDISEGENPVIDSFEINTQTTPKESTSVTSHDSIRIEKPSSNKTTVDIFQFLPFRSSTKKYSNV